MATFSCLTEERIKSATSSLSFSVGNSRKYRWTLGCRPAAAAAILLLITGSAENACVCGVFSQAIEILIIAHV
jgi:hypothetical protein